ncbi:hypothetical protein [Pseudomonas sp. TMP9]
MIQPCSNPYSSACWATISAAESMNLSGMQRMLSQRIAKLDLAMR